MKRLLLIHGRDQQGKNSTALKNEWLAAWDRGLAKSNLQRPAGLTIDFPFYGDRLAALVDAANRPTGPEASPKGVEGDRGYDDFQAEVADELARIHGLEPAAIRAQIARVHGDQVATQKGPLNWEWIQAIIALIDDAAPDLSSAVLGVLLRDVYLYLTEEDIREEVDSIASQNLSGDTVAVVGHSLGSVVGFNILRAFAKKNGGKKPRYVTVGSPLGINAIKQRLGRLSNAGSSWYNAFDERDVVALKPLDGNNFPVTPAIENNAAVSNHSSNRHGIVGYLDDKAVAKRIFDALA